MRIGNGFDIHRFVAGRPLMLGGIHIPYEKGLDGHSDGDALIHAIIDAILGAAALGDIGTWFPSHDLIYKNIESLQLLNKVIKAVHAQGHKICNIDNIIICEQPKLSPFYNKIRNRLSDALGISITQISVKATTSEGLLTKDAAEALAVQAIVLLE